MEESEASSSGSSVESESESQELFSGLDAKTIVFFVTRIKGL